MSDTPWRGYKGVMPDKATLWRWRQKALALARRKGARWVCEICKRPIGNEEKRTGAYGEVTLRAPSKNTAKAKKRKLCFACWATIDVLLDQLEVTGANEHLPAEDFGEKNDEA